MSPGVLGAAPLHRDPPAITAFSPSSWRTGTRVRACRCSGALLQKSLLFFSRLHWRQRRIGSRHENEALPHEKFHLSGHPPHPGANAGEKSTSGCSSRDPNKACVAAPVHAVRVSAAACLVEEGGGVFIYFFPPAELSSAAAPRTSACVKKREELEHVARGGGQRSGGLLDGCPQQLIKTQ